MINVERRQRSYHRTPLHNDLQRVLELNDRNNTNNMHAATIDKRIMKYGRQNRNEFNYYNEQVIQEEVDPVSFNSRRNASHGSITSSGIQSPEAQCSQRMSMNNEYLTRERQFTNFHH